MNTLVLSSSFLPLQIVSWKRAFVLLFSGRAEQIHVAEDRVIRSPNREHRVPTVIRYRNGGHRFFNRNGMSRDALYIRDGGKCGYCGEHVPKSRMTKDHVIPRCQSGKDIWDNVVLSCFPCNNKKGGRTPKEAEMRLSVAPHAPRIAYLRGKYHEHWQPYLFN